MTAPALERLSFRDHLFGAGSCAAYVALLLATAPAIGMSRDEGIYVGAADAYAAWIELLWREPAAALERDAIDRAFRVNREHPPLWKILFGVGHLAHEKWDLFADVSSSYRFAGMLSAGLLLWLIYVFGARLYGRATGVFAALAYALLPRPFYHAHLNAFDVPIVLANTAVVYAYWRSLVWQRSAAPNARAAALRWAYGCGALFGLALLTKHNSWVLPGVFAIHFALLSWLERRVRAASGERRQTLVPHALIACFTIGPALFLAGWPFLWHDTLKRAGWYAAFHLNHEYYNIEYFGVNYFWPPFPMSFPWVMTLFTVPLTTLVLGAMGLFHEVRALLAPLKAAGAERLQRIDPSLTTVLLLGVLFAPLVIITMPWTPIFGGTKHWFPAYPFLALFAGRAFTAIVERLRGRFAGRRWTGVIPVSIGAFLLAPAVVETAHSHPFGLSHYTVVAGGVPGAAELGMNRQFWGFTTRSLAPYLRQVMPQGGTLYICDTIYSAFVMLVRDGHLPSNIRATYDIAQADYALVHHEKHFAEVDHQIWTTYGTVQPVHVLTYDGVPIISVYRNPRE